VTVTIYVEGGGDSDYTRAKCREGFARYCEKVVPPNRRPRIVACGGRHQAFSRFVTAISASKGNDQCALVVDSEGPVGAEDNPANYLHVRDEWDFPPLQNHHVFLMVQAMEAWLLADRDALAAYYGAGFRLNALPGDERHIEAIPKNDLEPSLVQATRSTKTKGRYHKTRHAFDILSEIDPSKVESGSLFANAFHIFLRSV
jgi:hypothetical protein